jgi:MoxR-like ATPase
LGRDHESPQNGVMELRLLQGDLLERDVPVRLLLLAALAREHVLLIGPPGTAKSELARRLHRVVADAPYFERLLTRFSTPEELFGPLSLKALETTATNAWWPASCPPPASPSWTRCSRPIPPSSTRC